MKTIKVKEFTDRYGFKSLVYKEGRRKICEIMYPNRFSNGYRFETLYTCTGIYPTIDPCKATAHKFLNNFYSIFGGCEIVYNN